MKNVREVLAAKSSGVFSVSPDATVFEALQLMAEKEIGALVVLDAGRLVGIMSERDYARKVIVRGKASHDTRVREIMTTAVRAVEPDRPIAECMGLMADHQHRHLPVVEGGRVIGVVSIGDLVKEMMAEQEQTIRRLASVASHDALTGLFNRSMFTQRLNQALAQAERHGRRLAVLFVDLDGFKLINDTYGHNAGDTVLVDLARRLLRSMREGDTLGRLGGDEFVLLIESYHDESQLLEVARKVVETVAQPFMVGEARHVVTASVGIAAFPGDARTAQDLISCADRAMYQAKEAGKNQFSRFTGSEGVKE
jgi:diguanylate cyclase (GGDEF)-like protein